MQKTIFALAIIAFLGAHTLGQEPGKIPVPPEDRAAIRIAQLEIEVRDLQTKLLQVEIRERLTKILRAQGVREEDIGKFGYDPETGELRKK